MSNHPPESARELAERVLNECASVRFYGYGGAEVERDYDDATALIEADRAAVVAQALALIRAEATRLQKQAADLYNYHQQDPYHMGVEFATRTLLELLPPVEKAGTDG